MKKLKSIILYMVPVILLLFNAGCTKSEDTYCHSNSKSNITALDHSILKTSVTPVSGTVPGKVPGGVPGGVPGTDPGTTPGKVPGKVPGTPPSLGPCCGSGAK